ncbi:MAG TPA: NTP transferase domain-containing protein [Opitutales bacterium]|nr:NTP transferase domain-containing protein [Opitutales bacterium]
MPPTLVILAAGLGSRYGSLKQMDPLGPHGQTILDYSIYDAHRAGFAKIVFIIRRDFADAFRARITQNPQVRAGLAVDYVFQDLNALPAGFTPPPGREKPWGTAHAVWCTRMAVKEPFAVVNADDFYGADAFHQLAKFLRAAPVISTDFALVGYRLGQTLSEHGTVARGVCRADEKGNLVSIEEQTGLAPDPSGGANAKSATDASVHFPADTTVSMNCWALTPAVFPLLEAQFTQFLRERGAELKSECYLPRAIGEMLTLKQARVRVLTTNARWCGVTYQEDKPTVQAALKTLHDAGEYP